MASGVEAFSLYAKLILDSSEYEKSLSESEHKASGFGSKLASGLGTAAKAIGAGIAAAATGVAALTTSAVKAYADYEQLTGGVETLFKNSSDVVMGYAENAYKTAGLSANEYMETVTGFSASLLQSLDGDTAAAAEKADMAITDMADNANKMGSSMESIQNAYQGFAKQNYTMLDNLKLGYGGTKEEMQRLLEDAEKISGIKYDISSYADVVDAIHVMQTEMGIAGTTALEAEHTISGSLGMLKSSWQNLVTGLANPDADLGALISNVVESAKTAFGNLMPAIEQALDGITDLIQAVVPIIAKELPKLINKILPLLIDTAIKLLTALVNALPTIVQVLIAQLPTIIDAIIQTLLTLTPMLIDLGLDLILALADGIIEALPDLIPALVEVILTIVEKLTDPDTLTKLLEASIQIILALAEGLIKAIPKLIEAIPKILMNLVTYIIESAPMMLEAGAELMGKLGEALLDGILGIGEWIGDTFGGTVDAIKERWGEVTENVSESWEEVKQRWEVIGDWFSEKFTDAKEKAVNAWSNIKERFTTVKNNMQNAFNNSNTWFQTNFTKFKDSAVNAWSNIKQKFAEIKEKMKGGLDLGAALQWGKDLINNFIAGLKAKWESLKDTVKGIAKSIKNLLGFSEPKEGPLSNFHTYAPDMMDLFMQGIEDNKKKLQDTVANAFNFQPLMTPTYEISGNGGSQDILERIAAYLPQVANQNIVLDTGVLVGATVKQYDEALGKLTTNRARSV